MEILKLLVRVMIFLLSIIIIQSCGSNGWIIASIPVTPQDTVTNTVFIEIMDVDSTVHWFHGNISDYSNWCYRHQRLEEVIVQ
jgi:hypothetical protein